MAQHDLGPKQKGPEPGPKNQDHKLGVGYYTDVDEEGNIVTRTLTPGEVPPDIGRTFVQQGVGGSTYWQTTAPGYVPRPGESIQYMSKAAAAAADKQAAVDTARAKPEKQTVFDKLQQAIAAGLTQRGKGALAQARGSIAFGQAVAGGTPGVIEATKRFTGGVQAGVEAALPGGETPQTAFQRMVSPPPGKLPPGTEGLKQFVAESGDYTPEELAAFTNPLQLLTPEMIIRGLVATAGGQPRLSLEMAMLGLQEWARLNPGETVPAELLPSLTKVRTFLKDKGFGERLAEFGFPPTAAETAAGAAAKAAQQQRGFTTDELSQFRTTIADLLKLPMFTAGEITADTWEQLAYLPPPPEGIDPQTGLHEDGRDLTPEESLAFRDWTRWAQRYQTQKDAVAKYREDLAAASGRSQTAAQKEIESQEALQAGHFAEWRKAQVELTRLQIEQQQWEQKLFGYKQFFQFFSDPYLLNVAQSIGLLDELSSVLGFTIKLPAKVAEAEVREILRAIGPIDANNFASVLSEITFLTGWTIPELAKFVQGNVRIPARAVAAPQRV